MPTAFALVFVADGVRYEYRVAATRERVWHESLRAFPKAKEQLWFNRDWNAESGTYTWSPERPSGFQRDSQLEGYTLPNVLFLSKAVASNRPELEPVFRWFRERLKFIDLRPNNRIGLRFTLKRVEERTPLHDQIVNLLRHADLEVTDARAVDRRPSDEEVEKFASDLPPDVRKRILKDRWLQPELLHRGSNVAGLPCLGTPNLLERTVSSAWLALGWTFSARATSSAPMSLKPACIRSWCLNC